MKEFESEDISLFEELYTGLNQALEFAQGIGEAKITIYDKQNYNISNFAMASVS